MPLSTDILLARHRSPVFPDRCCVCGKPRPGDTIPVSRRSSLIGWDLLMPWLILMRRPVRRAAPACAPCRVEAIRYRRVQGVVFVVAVTVAVVFVMPWVKSFGWSRGQTRLASLLLVTLAVAPVIVWHMLRPRAFDISVKRDTVEYEFADADYAADFRAANQSPPSTTDLR